MPILWLNRGCVVAIAVMVATSLWAAPPVTAPAVATPTAVPSDLEFARLLVRAGRLGDARAFLEQARPAGDEDRLERHLLLGQIYLEQEMPGRAAEHYEAALAIRPDLTEIRLALARAHFLAGQDGRARHHFELSLGAGLPAPAVKAVESYLNAIEARKRWSGYFSVALLPESNAARRTDISEVDIGGIRFQLNDDARSASGTGLQLSFGGAYAPVLGDRLRGHLGLSTVARIHEDSALNDIAVTGKAGLTRLHETGSISGGLQAGRRWIGAEGFQRSTGLWGRVNHRNSERVRTSLRTELDFRRHDQTPERDGWRASLTPSVRVALDGQTLLEVSPGFELINAEAEHHASRAINLSAGIVRTFGKSLTASFSSSLQWRKYQGRDPLFDRTRKDRTFQLGGRLFQGSWRVQGFAPYLGYSYEKNTSNIELHDYSNHGVTAGLSREF